jgi:3-isopropylmalate/(R)-2-methylmalate dehydratase large subunit
MGESGTMKDGRRGMTIAEKIIARAAGRSWVAPGEYVTAKIDVAMMNDNIRYIPALLQKAGIKEGTFRIWDRERFVVVIDHRVPTPSLADAANHKKAREAAASLDVGHFYDIFEGVSHQVMVEKGHALPGELAVGADSHATTYGALNALGTGIGVTEMAYVAKTGQLWFKVPETIRFDLKGTLPECVSAKDIALFFAGCYGTDVAQYRAIEWSWSGAAELSIDGRLTLANMSLELGAKFAVFQADTKTENFCVLAPVGPSIRWTLILMPVRSDLLPGCVISCPSCGAPSQRRQCGAITRSSVFPIQQALIASCCNGRIEDIQAPLG